VSEQLRCIGDQASDMKGLSQLNMLRRSANDVSLMPQYFLSSREVYSWNGIKLRNTLYEERCTSHYSRNNSHFPIEIRDIR